MKNENLLTSRSSAMFWEINLLTSMLKVRGEDRCQTHVETANINLLA